MDYKAAIDALKKLDGGADLASVFEAEVDRLNGKNFEVIGEKRNATTKATAYEAALSAIGKALGLEGDIEAFLSSAEGKVKELASSLTSAQSKATDAETRAQAAEGKIKGLERSGKIATIAAKVGADSKVLERLLGDKVDELSIADDGVTIGDKALKDYVEADAELKPFLPALFPSQQTQQPARVLPGGNPTREQKTANPAGTAIAKMKFAVPGGTEQ